MFISELCEKDLSVELIDRLLFQGLEDTEEKADCIIVLGSIKAAKYRVPVAVDAYKAGRAGKLVLCGGTLRNFPEGNYSEAEIMQQTALDLGVSKEDIIIENTSQNTVENIRFALNELTRAVGINNIHCILLVTTTYHMRRSFAIARSIMPEHITIIPCPANDTNTRRDNWMHTPAGITRAKNEAMNIIRYVSSGVIPDFEI